MASRQAVQAIGADGVIFPAHRVVQVCTRALRQWRSRLNSARVARLPASSNSFSLASSDFGGQHFGFGHGNRGAGGGLGGERRGAT
jgi:hypothetical protein